MAHELRNPLTAISMLVQIQCEKAEQNGLPAEDLQMIEQEVGRMERRLNAFIDFARPPRPHRRRTDMVPLVAQTLALVAGRATKQNVNVEFDHPPTPVFIEADGEQVRQLLLNLFMNALDVMPRGGTLTLKLEQPSESRAELFVSDNGPGLDPKQLPRVFEPYFTSKEMGLGLGLPISQRIAQDHGGNLVATNRANGGACFILKLPTIAESIEFNQGTGHAESARDR
jgi:two-component system sensor histidine kinase HydH